MMKFEALRNEVCRCNRALAETGLSVLTWGNASQADRSAEVMAIKPSGVAYDVLLPEDIVVVSLKTGDVLAGTRNPSSDTPTHLYLYQVFDDIGGVVHTHSRAATAWAQAMREIPCMGTTHADHFNGSVPVTRLISAEEVKSEYEKNTGIVIEACFREHGLSPSDIPGVLVAGHGPFTWGSDAREALRNTVALEHIAAMALDTQMLATDISPIPAYLLDRHFQRKHGPDAYYGQNAKGDMS